MEKTDIKLFTKQGNEINMKFSNLFNMQKKTNKKEIKLREQHSINRGILEKMKPKTNRHNLTEVKTQNELNSYYYSDNDTLKKIIGQLQNTLLKKENEVTDLKLHYNKLYDEDESNRKLLEKTLDLNRLEDISANEMIDKIKSCNLSEKKKDELSEDLKLMNLRSEINIKKRTLQLTGYAYDDFKDNAKFKNVCEMEKELEFKTGKKEKLENDFNNYLIIYEVLKTNVEDAIKCYKKKENIFKNIKNEEDNYMIKIKENKENIFELQKNLVKLERTVKIQENNYQKNINSDMRLKINIESNKKEMDQINKYKQEREKLKNTLKERQLMVKNYDKKNNDIEKKINQLENNNQKLCSKYSECSKEKSKLEKKAIIPKEDKIKMKELKEKHLGIKNELKQNKKPDKPKKLDPKKREILERIENGEKNIQNYKNEIEELTKKKSEIQENIKKMNENLEKNEKDITEKQNELNEILKQKKEEELIQQKRENLIKEETEKYNNNPKAYKKEIKILQKQENDLKKLNENLNKENKKIKDELEDIEKELEKYK